jgi:hypothetical protein
MPWKRPNPDLQNDPTYLTPRLNEVDAQLADIASDDTFKNNSFISNMPSYIGVKNTGYTADDGTRFYLLPKDYVTAGTGGALKIFGDPYHLDQTKYRDLGIYFSQDQNGDTGYHGTGCFFINGKVAGVDYADKHPDLVFSFQDGLQIGGRIVRLNNESGTYTCFIFGSDNVEFADANGEIRAEVHGSMAIRNNHGVKWADTGGNLSGKVVYTTANRMREDSFAGYDKYVNNAKIIDSNGNGTKFYHSVINNVKSVITSSSDTTPNVAATNRLQMNQSATTTITNFLNGADGHELRILFSNANTTIENNANIKLSGGVNFVGSQYATLTLENFNGVWYEMSRSINHA